MLARDLLNSDYAGHRLAFQLFARPLPFPHLPAVYHNYDFSGLLDLVARYFRSRGRGPKMREPITIGGHLRIRPFNAADSYPEQRPGNDLCQAVVAGHTICLRGQVPQDLGDRLLAAPEAGLAAGVRSPPFGLPEWSSPDRCRGRSLTCGSR